MDSVILVTSVAAFAALGTIGLIAPMRIAGYFGNKTISSDQQNELRAVYGGLPFGIVALGVAALANISPLTIQQTLFAIAILLFGMAAGRFFAVCIQRPTKRSYIFLLLELLLGGLALYGFYL